MKPALRGMILASAFSGLYERPPFFLPEIAKAEGSNLSDFLRQAIVTRLHGCAQELLDAFDLYPAVAPIHSDFKSINMHHVGQAGLSMVTSLFID